MRKFQQIRGRLWAVAVLILLIAGTHSAVRYSPAQEAAQEAAAEARENTATIHTHNVTVIEGDDQARIPVTISSEFDGQTVEGIVLAIRVDNPKDTSKIAPVLDAEPEDAFGESLWQGHQNLIADVRPSPVGGMQFLLIPFAPPFGEIKADGMVCWITVDCSGMRDGEEYMINTAAEGRSSAVAITNPDPHTLSYTPVHLEHRGGKISVVAKKQ